MERLGQIFRHLFGFEIPVDWEGLPPEILCQIISYVTDPEDIRMLLNVSSKIRAITYDCITTLKWNDPLKIVDINADFVSVFPNVKEIYIPIGIDEIDVLFDIANLKHLDMVTFLSPLPLYHKEEEEDKILPISVTLVNYFIQEYCKRHKSCLQNNVITFMYIDGGMIKISPGTLIFTNPKEINQPDFIDEVLRLMLFIHNNGGLSTISSIEGNNKEIRVLGKFIPELTNYINNDITAYEAYDFLSRTNVSNIILPQEFWKYAYEISESFYFMLEGVPIKGTNKVFTTEIPVFMDQVPDFLHYFPNVIALGIREDLEFTPEQNLLILERIFKKGKIQKIYFYNYRDEIVPLITDPRIELRKGFN